MILLYVVVHVNDQTELMRLRAAVCRPWLDAYKNKVRYWVPPEEAERERAALALAGFVSQIEGVDFLS